MSNGSEITRLACLVAVICLAACTTKQQAASSSSPPATRTTAASAPIVHGIVPGSVQDFKVNVGDTIHFAYNEYNIQNRDRSTLQKQASWLNKYGNVQFIIEGHCDERGTREYNLALGARRANAVKEYLASLGVSSGRLLTVSYGKERPICTVSDEDCWAQNRRGVTTITGGAASS